MESVLEKIERTAIPEIEKALGRKATVVKGDGFVQFRIAAEENIADTEKGAWRDFIRGKVLEAGAADAKVSPIASPFRPDRYALYSVTALSEKRTFLAWR